MPSATAPLICALAIAFAPPVGEDEIELSSYAPPDARYEIGVPRGFVRLKEARNGWRLWFHGTKEAGLSPWLGVCEGEESPREAWRRALAEWGLEGEGAPALDAGQRVLTRDGAVARVWFDELELDGRRSYLAFAFVSTESTGRTTSLLFRCPAADRESWEATFQEIVRTIVADRYRVVLDRLVDEGRVSPKRAAQLLQALNADWAVTTSTRRRFLILHHSDAGSLSIANALATSLDPVADAVATLLPPIEPVDELGIFRVCASRKEYHAFGGPGGSAGYFSDGTGEAVLFDSSPATRADDDTLDMAHGLVSTRYLNAALEGSPHEWFRAGHCDYFAGTVVRRGRLAIRPFRWRTTPAKQLAERGEFVPLATFLRQDRSTFWSDPSDNSAQAWSLVYYLRELVEPSHRARWGDPLGRYWEVLRDGGTRDAALAAMLEGVDLAELEIAWASAIGAVE